MAICRRYHWLAVLVLLPMLPALPRASEVRGQPAHPTAATALQPAEPTDSEELEAFLDPIFAKHMAESHIPGAAFVFVHDGKVVFAKGYGYADLERNIPVDPDTTIFHVMSVSKLFTATAIMQLVEQGKIRLDADVNSYLKRFQIEQRFPEPVTIRHLLTRTDGFDFDLEDIGRVTRDSSKLQSLSDYLIANPPVRIQPPGQQYQYSNGAFDLLGAVVEEVSGQPFARYVDEAILRPLGMRHSSMAQPSPFAEQEARSYGFVDGRYQLVPFPLFHNAPSRGLSVTATDIARFMIAHLQGGRNEEAQILQEATAQAMHQPQFTYHPSMPGTTYGFFTAPANARPRSIWHEGHYSGGARSSLVLLPEEGDGFFVTFNTGSEESGSLIVALYNEFVPHFYPIDRGDVLPELPAEARSPPDRFAGVYRLTEYAHSTIAKATTLIQDDVPRVAASSDGKLTIRFAEDGDPVPLVEIEPLLFQAPNNDFRVQFRAGAGGRISHMMIGVSTFEQLAWYETSGTQQLFAWLFLAVFLLAALVWPAAALWRRLRKRPAAASGRAPRLAGLVAALVGALNVVFLVGLFVLLPRAEELGIEYGMPAPLIGLLTIPLLTSALAAVMVVFAILAWRRRYWGGGARVGYSLLALAALAFIPFLMRLNLFGFQW